MRPDTGACPCMGAVSRPSASLEREGRAKSARPAETVAVVGPTCPIREDGALRSDGLPQRKRYCIRRGRQMNIYELDQKGVQIGVWCFGPEGCLAVGDIMLAQKIALETDEHAALAVANRCLARPQVSTGRFA